MITPSTPVPLTISPAAKSWLKLNDRNNMINTYLMSYFHVEVRIFDFLLFLDSLTCFSVFLSILANPKEAQEFKKK